MAKLNCITGNVSGLEFRNGKDVKRYPLTYKEKDLGKSLKKTGLILYKRR